MHITGRIPGNRLPPKLVEFLIEAKTQDSRASIPEIIRRAVGAAARSTLPR
jgi:hypothetical protein